MEIIRELLSLLVPGPVGALWIGILVVFAVLADGRSLLSRRNLYLALLFAAAIPLVHIFRFQWGEFGRVMFTMLFLATAGYTVWGVWLSRRDAVIPWSPNLPRPVLAGLAVLMIALNAIVVLGRRPDDAGYYTNLGAQRWVETGRLPYADPLLKGPEAPGYGASATYGPILYAAHVPLQLALGTHGNPADSDPMDRSYRRPPILITQVTCFAFYLLGLFGLFSLVRRYGDLTLAYAAVAIFAASPYVLGLGGTDEVITGLAFISHIAPTALMLVALAAVARPFLSGALLAGAAGALFWPAFVFPAWLGWRIWRREGVVRFAAGFAVAGLAIGLGVLAFTPALDGAGPIELFVESTLEHQEGTGPQEYGSSRFGFWGVNPGLDAFWQEPLAGDSSLFAPMFLLYAAFVAASFLLARGRTVPQLAGLTAALAAAVQLWKTHAGGTYVEWYLPFLLVALLCVGRGERGGQDEETPAEERMAAATGGAT